MGPVRNKRKNEWRFGSFETAWLVGLILILFLTVTPYLGPTPNVLGEWSGTPAVLPAGLEQTAGRFARLEITGVDARGILSGTLKVDGVSGPIIGRLHGRHLSLIINSPSPSDPTYYGMGFEGTVRRNSIDGTLAEIGESQWNRKPLSYEVSLLPGSGE